SDGIISLVYRVSSTDVPSGEYDIYLGVDQAYLELNSVLYGSQSDRIFVGTLDAGGVYNAGFATQQTRSFEASEDFNMVFHFKNFGNGGASENWDNYIVRSTAEGKTTLLRADAYAMDNPGTFSYSYDWDWSDFNAIMRNADVEMNISRKEDVVSYKTLVTAENAKTYRYDAIHSGASTENMSIGLTCEKCGVDLLKVIVKNTIGDTVHAPTGTIKQSKSAWNLMHRPMFSANIYKNTLTFTNPMESFVKIHVFGINGQVIRDYSAIYSANTHRVDLSDIAQGQYLIRILSNNAKENFLIRIQ
ncbi:MAG: T9SS type A sorting domain-containing protein, partial [Fibrobacter sp.]|nr:T9SS type A sorting domain-containing protein [Fibrobacter sp.]